MEEPPRISEVPVKATPPEILPPRAALPTPAAPFADRPPVHALSALVLVAVDSLWATFDWMPADWVVAIPSCFAAVFVPSYLIQRHLKGDSKGRALTLATVLAVLAAIPTPITGTPIGLGLLAWTGLGKLLGRTPPNQSGGR